MFKGWLGGIGVRRTRWLLVAVCGAGLASVVFLPLARFYRYLEIRHFSWRSVNWREKRIGRPYSQSSARVVNANDPTCNDATGSPDFCTISAAVAAADGSVPIFVEPGTYPELVVIDKPLLLFSARAVDGNPQVWSGPQVIVGTPAGAFKIAADNVGIAGFTIQGVTAKCSTVPGASCAGVYVDGAHSGIFISGNLIQGNVVGIYLNTYGPYLNRVDSNVIRDNNERGPHSGIGIYSDFSKGDVVIRSNTIIGHNTAGLAFAGITPIYFVGASFNRIAGNAIGIHVTAPGTIEAFNNWWGCNGGPNGSGTLGRCDTTSGAVGSSPWMVMRLEAPTAPSPGQTGQVVATLNHNSDGDSTVGSLGTSGLNGTPITFRTDAGEVSNPAKLDPTGSASAVFTGATFGTAHVSASLDHESLSASR